MIHQIDYTIAGYSSFSGCYRPENILVDCPADQTSRWSSQDNVPPQFLLMKLAQPSVLCSIKFGKFEKGHICNLRKFKIFTGLDSTSMVEVFEGGLRNDAVGESFEVRFKIMDNHLPANYVKIVPLLSWGQNFNYSIWYVELHGIVESSIIEPAITWMNEFKQNEVVRQILKYFRDANQLDIFNLITERTRVNIEHPIVTKLYETLIGNGNFEETEKLISKAGQDGFLHRYLDSKSFTANWKNIESKTTETDVADWQPGIRGGHQMSINPNSGMIYLLSGWDGQKDLGDFWAYDIAANKWNCISSNTQDEQGPSARSCHKMLVDVDCDQIFVLGRYVDTGSRKEDPLKCDFYVYNIQAGTWHLISDDTGSVGGPALLFDHQMILDSPNRSIYCFGGKVLTKGVFSITEVGRASHELRYGDFQKYHIPTDTWSTLRKDSADAFVPTASHVRSRIGHSMLFHPNRRKIYILAGQRGKDYLPEMMSYDIDADTFEVLFDNNGFKRSNSGASGVMPIIGLTHRATIDPEKDLIYVFSCHYMFGGNPRSVSDPKHRLDDFWSLKLYRSTIEELLHEIFWEIRLQKFKELSATSQLEALNYLQTHVSALVNHSDRDQAKSVSFETKSHILDPSLWNAQLSPYPRRNWFRLIKRKQTPSKYRAPTDTEFDNAKFQQLTSLLFESQAEEFIPHLAEQHRLQRVTLFYKLISYFPDDMCPPRTNLIDFITL